MKIHLLKWRDLDSQANTASPPEKLSISHILLVLFNTQRGLLKIKSGLSQIFRVFFGLLLLSLISFITLLHISFIFPNVHALLFDNYVVVSNWSHMVLLYS